MSTIQHKYVAVKNQLVLDRMLPRIIFFSSFPIASGTENLSIAPAAEVVLKRTKSLDFSGCSSGSERSTSPRHRRDRSDDTHSSYEMSTAFRGEVRKYL